MVHDGACIFVCAYLNSINGVCISSNWDAVDCVPGLRTSVMCVCVCVMKMLSELGMKTVRCGRWFRCADNGR